MQNQADHGMENRRLNIDALHRIDSGWIRGCSRRFLVRLSAILLVLVGAITSGGMTRAEDLHPMPPGMKGWTYMIRLNEVGYVSTPEEACVLNAANHWGTPLRAMRPSEYPKPVFHCFYANPVGGLVDDYGITHLECEVGYTRLAAGVCTKWAEPARPAGCAEGEAGFTINNPVVLSSGSKVQTEMDFPGLPNGALRVTRTYRSLRDFGAGQSAGRAWSFSFDRQFSVLVRIFGAKLPDQITGTYGDGSTFDFQLTSTGTWVPRHDKRETLTSLTDALDEWMLTTSDGTIERYKRINSQFLLISSHTREGVGQFYTYDSENKLATISDASGRTLSVIWTHGAVTSITGDAGSVRYRYESVQPQAITPLPGTERLAAVDVYDAKDQLVTTKRYHYEDPNYRHLLTGIMDENGARFATYAYNDSGQTVLSEHAGGADRHTFAYPAKEKRVVTDALGTQRVYDLTFGADASGRVSATSQPGGAGCGPGYSKRTYDDQGRQSSSIDFNERKTCFITEPARGLVTSEVSGLGAAATCPTSGTEAIADSSRRVSTRWHPDVDLETAVASAKRITKYVYNGQPDANGAMASCAENATLPNGKPIIVLCTKTVQATRDANGAHGFAAQPDGRPRTWLYSYNASGQLLKQTGPKDIAGQAPSTSHVYYTDTSESHTRGDLASTQNAAGEVTRFLEYTKDGLASKIKGPDGVVVNLVYGIRQRITSSTIEDGRGGAETTEYSYDDVGQLTRLAFPDGAALTFAYDDAHRLTALTDGAGNRIELTLDNMGNAIRQELRNAAGQLVLESNRAVDALNRVASVQRSLESPATKYEYDRNGNVTAVKDALGRVTTLEFDNLDRLAKAVMPPAVAGTPATTIGLGFDHQDQLVSVTDPRQLSTRYTMDGHGQRTTLASPDTGAAAYTFDDAGNLVSSRDARGVTLDYRYDAAQRVTKIGNSSFEYGKDVR